MTQPAEQIIADGIDHAGPAVLLIPPLFDEANRLRRSLIQLMRALDAAGIPSLLPDLPGTNESLIPTQDATLGLWTKAVGAIADSLSEPPLIASFRGGALIDHQGAACGHWRLAPVAGNSLLRTLFRTRMAADKEQGIVTTLDTIQHSAMVDGALLAGNMLSATMVAELVAAQPVDVAPLRSVTLGSGPDQLSGAALWLRAEPGDDLTLVQSVANDLIEWRAQCANT